MFEKFRIENFKTIQDKDLLKMDSQFDVHINPFVYSGYRIPTNHFGECAKTLCHLHNEFVNIWSHVIGFFIFLGIGIYWTYHYYSNSHFWERFAVYSYLLSLLFLYFSSSLYHLSIGHSSKLANQCQCIDWISISLVCATSAFYSGYYEIYQKMDKKEYYIAFVFILFCMMLFCGYLSKKSLDECHTRTEEDEKTCQERKKKNEMIRTWLNMIFALSTFGTWVIHYVWLGMPSFHEMDEGMKDRFVSVFFTYLSYGMVIFKLLSIPERWSAYTFDIFGYSHQIFHFGVVLGALILWSTYQKKIKL